MFLSLQEDLDLTGPCKSTILSLDLQKKWQIFSSKELPLEGKVTLSPEYYIDRLGNVMVTYFLNSMETVILFPWKLLI